MKANRLQVASQTQTPIDYRQRAKEVRPPTVAERAAEMGRSAATKSKAKLTKRDLKKLDQNA